MWKKIQFNCFNLCDCNEFDTTFLLGELSVYLDEKLIKRIE